MTSTGNRAGYTLAQLLCHGGWKHDDMRISSASLTPYTALYLGEAIPKKGNTEGYPLATRSSCCINNVFYTTCIVSWHKHIHIIKWHTLQQNGRLHVRSTVGTLVSRLVSVPALVWRASPSTSRVGGANTPD